MSVLKRTWHTIRRFIAPTDATAVADPAADAGTGRRNDILETLRAGNRWVSRFCEQFKEQRQETLRDSERVREDAMRKERRAKRKALLLLLKQLNPEQRQEFRKYRHFHVIGGSSGDRYRIRVDMIANIDVLRDDGKAKYRLCVRPVDDVPMYDVMAAQLLHLQDPRTEPRFLQQANIHSTLPESHVCFRTTWGS